ncbi:hypothetical protein GZ78_17910 [Endozoicomonas numazuensis]|uniref:Uncharacterized protein n=1 Tax=Endozoicomonas numazuensis TaxID=1137799 RepID=A0A081NGN1_9GAMM|nr:hypothetical protein GZ78_17910 [Endozoicomonas numazuensis]
MYLSPKRITARQVQVDKNDDGETRRLTDNSARSEDGRIFRPICCRRSRAVYSRTLFSVSLLETIFDALTTNPFTPALVKRLAKYQPEFFVKLLHQANMSELTAQEYDAYLSGLPDLQNTAVLSVRENVLFRPSHL